ncbi:MAG: peroxiredoxin [Immundisolibacter sp.]|uniref:peroxiredoxin n=1 Tax=Immundisolibacter sp. TaxID=1934948 RepID=UPI003EE2F577
MQRTLTALLLLLLPVLAAAGEPPALGAAAPGFSLPDQAGKTHALSDYAGRWLVLYFYPKDDTSGCTTEACNFRDDIVRIRRLGAEVVGVSVDGVASHADFAAKHELPFPLLADEGGTVAESYGALRDLVVMKMAKRQTYIIDPKGRIAHRYLEVDPKTHAAKVLADLERLQKAGG